MGLFNYILLHCIVFIDVNLTLSPLDRPITAIGIYKGAFHEDVACQHPLFVNNLNNSHYLINYLINSISMSTNDHRNSKTNHLITN